MEVDLIDLLKTFPELVFFLVLGFGYLIGNIRLGPIQLGPTAGVLIAGLVFGHFGLGIVGRTMEIGFIIFIYSVGLQAGPRFFSVFLEDGKKYVSLSVFTAITAFLTALALSRLLDFSPGHAAGLLAGGLTSTPTLAAAQDAVKSGLYKLGEVETLETVIREISVGYAITYLFGLIGLLVMIKLLPMLLKIDLPEEAIKLAEEKGLKEESLDQREADESKRPMVRAYELRSPEMIGKSLSALNFRLKTGCVVESIKRGEEMFRPNADTVLQEGDRLSVVGHLVRHQKLAKMIGPEVIDPELLSTPVDTMEVVISHPDAAGKSLNDIHMLAQSGCYITQIMRSQVQLPVSPELVLQKGDVVRLTGLRNRVEEAASKLGHIERNVHETDLLTFAFGIAAGLLLSKITVKLGVLTIGLGTAGGLLLTGILVGFLRSVNPTFGRMPRAARWVIMELGLMFFMGGIGLKAGGGIAEAIQSVGFELFISGVAVTVVPLLLSFFFGYYFLRINAALLLGALTGAMTSTPALNIVTSAAKSSLPALGYAGTYAFANIFLALAGTLIMLL